MDKGVRFGNHPGQVHAMAVWNDGSGAHLYVGGEFTHAGEAAAAYIARWDGSHWSRLGAGLEGTVRALVVLDDGRGPALYAAGSIGRVARWDGKEWSPVATVPGVVSVMTAVTRDDHRSLWVGGLFPKIDDQVSVNLACGMLVR